MPTNKPSNQIGDEASNEVVGRGYFPAVEKHISDAAQKNIAGAGRNALAAATRGVEYSLLASTSDVVWPASILAIEPQCEFDPAKPAAAQSGPQVLTLQMIAIRPSMPDLFDGDQSTKPSRENLHEYKHGQTVLRGI
jgi:hypothetical protein